MALAPGTRLGPFEVLDSLGKGGMGEVYRARDAKLGRDVAIKVLPGHVSAEARSRFEREARAVAALNHPHIVTIHDVRQADGIDFIVMELVTGRSLDRLIPERGLPIDRVLDYGVQIARALEAAHHARIVHRDIKPANVMVSDAGEVKVLDFGLAKVGENLGPGDATLTADLATAAGTVMGTVAYMSPEQAQGRPVDERSDVFSLGAVLYEMLAGRRAFQGETQMATLAVILAGAPPSLASLRPDAPTSLARLVADCLQKDSAARPTAAAIVERLAAMSRKASAVRRPVWVTSLAGIVALAVVAVGGWLVKSNVDARWVRTTGMPEVRRLVAARNYFEAFVRAREVRRYASSDPELEGLWKEMASTRSITSDPSDAEVAVGVPLRKGPEGAAVCAGALGPVGAASRTSAGDCMIGDVRRASARSR